MILHLAQIVCSLECCASDSSELSSAHKSPVVGVKAYRGRCRGQHLAPELPVMVADPTAGAMVDTIGRHSVRKSSRSRLRSRITTDALLNKGPTTPTSPKGGYSDVTMSTGFSRLASVC